MILEISRFESLHPALKSGVARECIHLASGRLKDITSMHIGALVKLAGQQSGRKINLPYGIIAEKSFGEVILFAGRCDDEKEEIHITQKELEALSATGEQKTSGFRQMARMSHFVYKILMVKWTKFPKTIYEMV